MLVQILPILIIIIICIWLSLIDWSNGNEWMNEKFFFLLFSKKNILIFSCVIIHLHHHHHHHSNIYLNRIYHHHHHWSKKCQKKNECTNEMKWCQLAHLIVWWLWQPDWRLFFFIFFWRPTILPIIIIIDQIGVNIIRSWWWWLWWIKSVYWKKKKW